VNILKSKLYLLKKLDMKLGVFKNARGMERPPGGWIRTVREAIGMESRQLSERIGSSPTSGRASRIEKDEVKGGVTLRTMDKVAEAMGCRFVYAIVPSNEESFETMVRARAKKVIESQLAEEVKQYGVSELEILEQEMIEHLLRTMKSGLWGEH